MSLKREQFFFETEEQANAFLQNARLAGSFDLFSSSLKTVTKIRSKGKKRNKLNISDRQQLGDLYRRVLFLGRYSSTNLFREVVPEAEIAVWFNHIVDILQQNIDNELWVKTGNLERHDELLFVTFCALAQHPLPAAMVFEEEHSRILKTITSMIISRKGESNKLPHPDFVVALDSVVCALLNSGTNEFDNKWLPFKMFRKLDVIGDGFLEQYLSCALVQTRDNGEMRKQTFEDMLYCTRYARKRLKAGTPCGDTLRAILPQTLHAANCCSIILPYLQTLVELSTVSQIRGDGCRYCLRDAVVFCARCKETPYCSKECQRADWKEHKTTCQECDQAATDGAFETLSTKAIRQILERAYFDIMVQLVQEIDKAGGVELTEMAIELNFVQDGHGRIPILQHPPQFQIFHISRYVDGTRHKELYESFRRTPSAASLEQEFTEMRSTLFRRKEWMPCLICCEIQNRGIAIMRHQLFTKHGDKPMFTQETVDAFRIAMVDDDYSGISAIFEDPEIVESYGDRIRSLQRARAE